MQKSPLVFQALPIWFLQLLCNNQNTFTMLLEFCVAEKILFFYVIHIFTCMSMSKSDSHFQLFEDFFQEKPILNQSPKVWHTFVAKFLDRILRNRRQYSSVHSARVVLQKTWHFSNQFMTLAQKASLENCRETSLIEDYNWCMNITYKLNDKCYFPEKNADKMKRNNSKLECASLINYTVSTVDFQMKRFIESLTNATHATPSSRKIQECLTLKRHLLKPTGWFLCEATQINHFETLAFDPYHSLSRVTHTQLIWKLASPHRFAIFLLYVEHMDFPSADTSLCIACKFLISNSGKVPGHLQFCGMLSALHIFVPYVVSAVQLDCEYDLHFALKAFCSLTDKVIVSNALHLEHSSPHLQFIYYIHGEDKQFCLRTYHIVVKKIHVVRISLLPPGDVQYKVLDGPSDSASNIVPQTNIVISSTFQCYVVTLAKNLSAEQTFGFKSLMNYSYKNLNWINITTKEQSYKIMFHGAHRQDQTYRAKLQAQYAFHLNITIIQMIFDGIDKVTCLHGGITFYEQIDHVDKELLTLCTSEQSKVGVGRSIYSTGSNIFFLIYQYQSYNSVVSHIISSLTKCKSSVLDLSLISKHCCLSYKKCQNYIKQISSTFVAFSISNYYHLKFFLQNTVCVVLQMRKSGRAHQGNDVMLVHSAWNMTKMLQFLRQ